MSEKVPSIKTISLERLVPYARNSRTHSAEQIDKIAASIREFGFLNPIIIDGENGIVAGHGRILAARKLGMDDVPCVEAAHLSEAQKRAYIIADNKLALDAGWDEELLRLEFDELAGLDFDLDLTGFEDDEIDAILEAPQKLREKDVVITPIRMTRILLSIPAGLEIVGIDAVLKSIVVMGGEVDYGGN